MYEPKPCPFCKKKTKIEDEENFAFYVVHAEDNDCDFLSMEIDALSTDDAALKWNENIYRLTGER